jgi:hypothetical protein
MRIDIPVSHSNTRADRYEELQAAYKEGQSRIAAFEKVLRERTPLGSIDQADDFNNYLNTLSMRTNVDQLDSLADGRCHLRN